MTKNDFILKTIVSLVSNPLFTNKEEDEDGEFLCLDFNGLCANANGLADWMEENDGVIFDNEEDS